MAERRSGSGERFGKLKGECLQDVASFGSEGNGLGSTHVFPIITEPSFVSYLNASLSRITLLRIIPAFGFVTTYFGTGHSFTSRLKTANNYDLIDTGRFAVFFHIAKIS